uniref:Serine-threonine/tyrosine-protein kinase catalytic domain-containing protein n=1 Tax=Oryza brachyantha TaxID=4533 RepID=J3N937_ORYBR
MEEYGARNMLSKSGDIYSSGILVLETITGNRTDSKFRQGLSLHECVELALHNNMTDVVDSWLLDRKYLQTNYDFSIKRKIDCLMLLLRLGMSSSQERALSRLPSGDIIKELVAIKQSL